MTGYTVHTGSNEKFSTGWDAIFGTAGSKKKAVRPAKPKAAKAKRAGKSKKKK